MHCIEMVCKCEEKSENHQEFFKHSIFVKDEDDSPKHEAFTDIEYIKPA